MESPQDQLTESFAVYPWLENFSGVGQQNLDFSGLQEGGIGRRR
jgi:hypothetical protein